MGGILWYCWQEQVAALTIGLFWKGKKHLSTSSLSVTFHGITHGNNVLTKFTWLLLFAKTLVNLVFVNFVPGEGR